MNKKEKIIFVSIILVSILIVYFPYLFMDREFYNSYDTLNTHIPFYTEFRNKIYSGDSILWSHNFLFGSSFLTGKAFFLTSDIFSYVFLLFPFLEVVDALFVMMLIKNIISYYGMYRFLSEFNFNFKTKIVCSLAYTFSGWFFLLYGMPTFVSFAAILPFFFTGIEKYLKDNKTLEIVLTTPILICSNFYFFYSLSIFLVFYWIARYLLYSSSDFKFLNFFKKTIILLFLYCIGIGISAPIIVPAIYEMLNNARATSVDSLNILWEPLNIYINMFIKFVSSPAYINKPYNAVLQSNYYRLDQIGLFTSCCTCIVLPQLYSLVSGKKRKIIVIFSVIACLFLFTQYGCSIFHGFSEPSFRWTLFLTFLFCILLAYVFNNIEKISKKLLIITLVCYLALIILIIFNYQIFQNSKSQSLFLSLSLFLMIIYTIGLIKHDDKILYLIACEIVIIGFISNYMWKDTYQKSYQYDFIPNNYFQSIDDSDEFYRIWIANENVDMDYQKDFNFNSNLVLGYKGLYSYDSTYQTSINHLLKSYEQYYQWYSFVNNGIMNAVSTKYYVAKNEYEIPNSNIQFIEKIGNSNYNLYLNKDYKKFGYMNNNVISLEDWSSCDIYTKDELINNYLIISDSDISSYNLNDLSEIAPNSLSNLSYTSNTINGDISTNEDGLLFLSIPNDKGWHIYCDGIELTKIQTNAGFISVIVPQGNHHINAKYFPYGLKLGCVFMVLSISIYLLIRKKFIK